jgi:nucleoside-diphosphate-sugar epimerase
MLISQGRTVPEKAVPRWLVTTVAAVSERISAITGGRWHPPVTRQMLAPSAVEVTLNIAKARRELGYEPPISRAMGLEELRSAAFIPPPL